MADTGYQPVAHDHHAFLKKTLKRKGFREAYQELADGYDLVRELLAARSNAGLTQEEVAKQMGTTKSAVSRLEAGGKHSPSVATLKKYAKAVGCEVEIRLHQAPRPAPSAQQKDQSSRLI